MILEGALIVGNTVYRTTNIFFQILVRVCDVDIEFLL